MAFQILEDDHGYFWMNCNKGVFRASKKELNDFADGRIRRIRSLSFGISEGVRGVESTGPAQPAGWKSRDGKLWFPTIKGVAVVDPDYRKRNEHVPPVLIEKMVVEGTWSTRRRRWSSARGARRLEFTFTALSFLVPEKNRFKTMLQRIRPRLERRDQPEAGLLYQPAAGQLHLPGDRLQQRRQWNREGRQPALRVAPLLFPDVLVLGRSPSWGCCS